MYKYSAIVVSVHDGDTLTLDIDLGLGVWVHGVKVRLQGVDTPELNEPLGQEAKDFLLRRVPIGSRVVVQTIRDRTGKYGRLLGEIYTNNKSINEEIKERYGEY